MNRFVQVKTLTTILTFYIFIYICLLMITNIRLLLSDLCLKTQAENIFEEIINYSHMTIDICLNMQDLMSFEGECLQLTSTPRKTKKFFQKNAKLNENFPKMLVIIFYFYYNIWLNYIYI